MDFCVNVYYVNVNVSCCQHLFSPLSVSFSKSGGIVCRNFS